MNARHFSLLIALLAFLFSEIALAHPMGSKLFAHKLRLSLSEDRLIVDYMAEVPIRRIQADLEAFEELGGSDFTSSIIEELSRALHISVDGQPLAMTSVGLGRGHVRENPRFTVFELRLEGRLPADANALQFQNNNYLEEMAFFSTEVLVSESISVSECSLFQLQEGKPLQDKSQRWWIDENMRELSLQFEATDPRVLELMRKLDGETAPYQTASAAYLRNDLKKATPAEDSPKRLLFALGLCIGLVYMTKTRVR